MTSTSPSLHVFSATDLPEYPISADSRLDSHYFVQFNHDRYDRSGFRRRAYRDPEVGFFGMELFFKSHGETPLGTLPPDDDALAFLLGLPLDRWLSLRERAFSPLYNWSPVICDNGEIRLAHPVVREVMQAALASRANHQARVEAASRSKRLKRLTEDVMSLAPDLASDPRKIRFIEQFIQDRLAQRGGERRTSEDLHAAIQECIAKSRLGGFPNPSTL